MPKKTSGIEVEIGDYVITHDGTCVAITKKPSESGYIKIVGYFPKLEDALIRLMEEKIADSDAKNIEELIITIKQIHKEIKETFSGCVIRL